MVDVMLAGTASGFRDRLLRLALGANEEHLAAGLDRAANEIERTGEQRNALRQIDDVNAIAITKDVRLHLRVPAVGLVAEVGAGFQKLRHRDDGCRHSSLSSIRLVRCRRCSGCPDTGWVAPACGYRHDCRCRGAYPQHRLRVKSAAPPPRQGRRAPISRESPERRLARCPLAALPPRVSSPPTRR